MSLSPLQQELAISTVKVLVIFSALMTLFSLMTYVERRVLAFMQFRLGPNRTGPFGLLQPAWSARGSTRSSGWSFIDGRERNRGPAGFQVAG